MSWLNLNKRFQPAKKAWKILTTKLHSNLHKLKTSKSIKKRLKTTSKSVFQTTCVVRNSFFRPTVDECRRRANMCPQTTRIHRCCYHFQRQPEPIYINRLFIEPASAVVEHHIRPPAAVATCKGAVGESRRLRVEEAELQHQLPDNDKMCEADEMWESLGLESPLMNGINERAEEFITRIRAEMQLQEILARQ
ncbi:hypothetical protein U1Q18_034006, partial [Sarracenia purpurea var. burkii]